MARPLRGGGGKGRAISEGLFSSSLVDSDPDSDLKSYKALILFRF